MTSLPAVQTVVSARPAMPAPGGAPAAMGSIDPVKLLNRYKWALAVAAVAGGIMGAGAYVVVTQFFPRWRPIALFNCLPQASDASNVAAMSSDQEMLRFMATQARFMTSDTVFTRVSEDPQLINSAPKWSDRFNTTDPQTGLPRFDTQEAAKELKDNVSAHVIPQTTLLELSISYRDKTDATQVLKLVREKYEALLREQTMGDLDDRIKSVRDSLSRYEQEISGYTTKRDALIKNRGLTSVDNALETTRTELADVGQRLLSIGQQLDSGRVQLGQLEQELTNPAGVTYGDDLRAEVEKDPLILDLKADIARTENSLQMLLNQGISRNHRQYEAVEAQLIGARQNLETKRAEQLRKSFDAQLDTLRKATASFEAQQKSLDNRRQELSNRMTDLSTVQAQLNDIANQINSLQLAKATANADLQRLVSLTQVAAANRVVLLQPERIPTQMSLPTWKVMIPGGMAAGIALMGALALLREIVDQRIKGPSDVSIIPRTRLVGWVPDAAEDLAGQGAPETAFRDRPKGVLAESYRQIRSGLAKRIQAADYRTLLVLAGMPGSGASTTVANLAVAFATADRRVLMIDANFRRPSLHRTFGLQESPGLGDVLGKAAEFAQVVQATSTQNLDLLTAGSKEHRVFERLSTEAMSEVLSKARAAYDLVIIDVAPAIVAGDGVSLAQRCDANLLVIRALAEKRGMVARFRQELSEVKGEFLGVIVNAVKHSAGGYMKRNIKTAYEYQQA